MEEGADKLRCVEPTGPWYRPVKPSGRRDECLGVVLMRRTRNMLNAVENHRLIVIVILAVFVRQVSGGAQPEGEIVGDRLGRPTESRDRSRVPQISQGGSWLRAWPWHGRRGMDRA